MRTSGGEEAYSSAATHLLSAVARSAPLYPKLENTGEALVLRYLAGELSLAEAHGVETSAVGDADLRQLFGKVLSELDELQAVPYGELVRRRPASEFKDALRLEWQSIVDRHVATLSHWLSGPMPATWPAIRAMSAGGRDGAQAAKTLWRALAASSTSRTRHVPIRLGFGFRRGVRGAIESVGPPSTSASFSDLEAIVLPTGDLSITLRSVPDAEDRIVFFAIFIQGRALPVAEATVINERASAVAHDLGRFLQIPEGPVPAHDIVAQLGGWPIGCSHWLFGVDAVDGPIPPMEVPNIRNGCLEVNAHFDRPESKGEWELMVAVTPNSWQMLGKFDIKCVTGGPQVLLAEMPNTAEEGPFGGALWLRRPRPA